MGLTDLLLRRKTEERDATVVWPTISVDDWAGMFGSWGGWGGIQQSMQNDRQEIISPDFQSVVSSAYKRNGVVFAIELARLLLFSEARFQWQNVTGGRPGALFGDTALRILEQPWPGGTTGDLLTRMLQDVDFGGNSFTVRRNNRLCRLRPDWTTIIVGSRTNDSVQIGDIDAEIIGFSYQPGGPGSGRDPVPLLAEEVAHFAPIPDPTSQFRGMSWLQPVVEEVMGDKAATAHKLKFFELGATPNMVVSFDKDVKKESVEKFMEKFKDRHQGVENAYRTLFLLGGATATPVGANMKEIEFKVTQGAGETRLAAAAGVPPVIVGLSEGLASATYSNYAMARRRFADMTMRPLWRNAAGSLQKIIQQPDSNPGARLWYDDRDIPALQEDMKDAAEVLGTKATAIRTLTDGGYTPDSVVAAVDSGDLTKLVHGGLVPVQLHPADEATNGNKALPAPA